MARHEADREDLFAEFRSAVEKWELSLPEFPEPILMGVRKDGRLSLYFGQDPCFHFDQHNRLQRAFVNGALYRSQGTTLARLIRERTATETILQRTDLEEEELQRLLKMMRMLLSAVSSVLLQQSYTVLRSAGDLASLLEIQSHLEKAACEQTLLAPGYPTRR